MSRREGYPQGPNGMAQACEDTIAELEAQRLTVARSERRAINQRLHTIRELLAWSKTRAGYSNGRDARCTIGQESRAVGLPRPMEG